MALDIRGKMILALNDPDEAGKWQSKMSNRLYCRFEQSRPGQVDHVVLHQLVQLTRSSPLEEMPEDVPDDVRPLLSKYLLPQLQAEFAVLFRDGSLAVNDPVAKRLIRLKPTDQPGRWIDEFDKNGIYFEYDDSRQIKAMIIDSLTRFRRQEEDGADGAP